LPVVILYFAACVLLSWDAAPQSIGWPGCFELWGDTLARPSWT